MYKQCSENKGADQLSVTAKLICAFVFAYAHNKAQMPNNHFFRPGSNLRAFEICQCLSVLFL